MCDLNIISSCVVKVPWIAICLVSVFISIIEIYLFIYFLRLKVTILTFSSYIIQEADVQIFCTMKLFMFNVFSHYICYLLDLMLYLLFIVSLESIHQLLTKNSKVITSCNYQKCKLKTKHFGHKIVPKILTHENVCFQKLECLKILKRQQKFKNLNIWPEKPWEMKISVGVCKFLS